MNRAGGKALELCLALRAVNVKLESLLPRNKLADGSKSILQDETFNIHCFLVARDELHCDSTAQALTVHNHIRALKFLVLPNPIQARLRINI